MDSIRGYASRLILLFVFASFGVIYAQQAGHYVGGITGLENGSAAPPGEYVTYLPYVAKIDSIKGPRGNTIIPVNLSTVAHNIGFTVMFPQKILGGNYGAGVIIPVVNTRFIAAQFDTSAEEAGVSDIFVEPIILGWEKGRANFTVNYGFYTTAGSFDPSKAMNDGLGFWEHQIQAGTTYSFDKARQWNASLLTTWEINQSKIGVDLKPGPMFTGEYSLGRRFFKEQMNAGIAGYTYHKLSPDTGSGVSPLVAGALDRQMGIGPEWKYTNMKWHMAFDFRYEKQFAAESKTSGQVFVMGITYLRLNLPHKP